jgi:hypothetical protein
MARVSNGSSSAGHTSDEDDQLQHLYDEAAVLRAAARDAMDAATAAARVAARALEAAGRAAAAALDAEARACDETRRDDASRKRRRH